MEYTIKNATEYEICSHLHECNENFVPPLCERVNIEAYAKKIFEHAVLFEAWEDHILVGCVAAYFNDYIRGLAYITNVSVVKMFMGLGIASRLLTMCISYAGRNHFSEIRLEVHTQNHNAVCLYRKFGFIDYGLNDDRLLMKLEIHNDNQPL